MSHEKLHGTSAASAAITELRIGLQKLDHGLLGAVNGVLCTRPEVRDTTFDAWRAADHGDDFAKLIDRAAAAAPAGMDRKEVEAAAESLGKALFERYNGMARQWPEEIRRQVGSLAAREAGTTVMHGAKDLARGVASLFGHDKGESQHTRDEIIAGMFDAGKSGSALSQMIRHDTEAALKAYFRQAGDHAAKAGGAVPTETRKQDWMDHAVRQVGVPELPEAAIPLRRKLVMADFATRLVDAYTRPRPEVAAAHAEAVLKEVESLRAKLSDLTHRVADGKDVAPDYQWSSRTNRVFGANLQSKKDFVREVDDLMQKGADNLLRACHARNLGMDPDQQRLLDHMHSNYPHKIFQAGANVSTALSTLAFFNALMPGPGMAVGRTAFLAARGAVGFAGSVAALYPGGESVTNAKGHRVLQNPDLGAADWSTLSKRLTRLTSEKIDQIMGQVDEDRMEKVLAPMVEKGKERMAFTRALFGSENEASAFLERHGNHFELFARIQDALKQQEIRQAAEVKKASSLPALERNTRPAEEALAATRTDLKTLAGVHHNFALGEIAEAEKFSALVSVMAADPEATPAGAGQRLQRQAQRLIAGIKDEKVRGALEQELAQLPGKAATPVPAGQELLSPQRVARQMGLESADFRQLTEELSNAAFGHFKSDAALKSSSDAALANTVSTVITGMLTSVPGAFISAAVPGPVGLAGAAALGAAGNATIGKVGRMVTNQVRRAGDEHAAAVGKLSTLANPASPLPSKEKLAQAIQDGWPSIVELRKSNRNEVIKAKVQDAMVKITEHRFEIGRLTLSALLAAGPRAGAGSEQPTVAPPEALHALLAVEKANARLNHSNQRLADLDGDRKRIDAAASRIEAAQAYAGGKKEGVDGKDALAENSLVRKTLASVEKHEARRARAEESLIANGPALVDHLVGTLRQIKREHPHDGPPRLSQEDWANIKAFFLFPSGHKVLQDKLVKAEAELRREGLLLPEHPAPAAASSLPGSRYRKLDEAATASYNTSNFLSKLHDLKAWDDDGDAFAKELARHGRKIENFKADITALVTDHQKFLAGDIEEVQDRFGLYDHMLDNYGSEQVEVKKAITPAIYNDARAAGRVVAGGLTQGALILGAGIGFALKPLPPIAVEGVGKVNLTGAAQGAIGSLNPAYMSPLDSSGNKMSHHAVATPGFLGTAQELGGQGLEHLDIAAVLNGMDKTYVRDPAHRHGVSEHPRFGTFNRQMVNLPGGNGLAEAARQAEGPGSLKRAVQGMGAELNPVTHVRNWRATHTDAAKAEIGALHTILSAEGQRERRAARAMATAERGPEAGGTESLAGLVHRLMVNDEPAEASG